MFAVLIYSLINMNHPKIDMTEGVRKARSGSTADVDFLMNILSEHTSLPECKMTDYLLGLVETTGGCDRIKYYLFNGNPVQRNYAALYFKRKGNSKLLNEAVRKLCIDKVQASVK